MGPKRFDTERSEVENLVVYTGATEILLLIAPTGRNPLRVPSEASVLPTHDKITPVAFFYNGTYGLHEV